MSNDIKKKGFLERIPAFSLILIMAVLMVVGGALIPLLRISYHPSPEQGKRLTISFSWPGASQRVIEQEITSKWKDWLPRWWAWRKLLPCHHKETEV